MYAFYIAILKPFGNLKFPNGQNKEFFWYFKTTHIDNKLKIFSFSSAARLMEMLTHEIRTHNQWDYQCL